MRLFWYKSCFNCVSCDDCHMKQTILNTLYTIGFTAVAQLDPVYKEIAKHCKYYGSCGSD